MRMEYLYVMISVLFKLTEDGKVWSQVMKDIAYYNWYRLKRSYTKVGTPVYELEYIKEKTSVKFAKSSKLTDEHERLFYLFLKDVTWVNFIKTDKDVKREQQAEEN